jgi:putative hydrolase of the HAD superfamily
MENNFGMDYEKGLLSSQEFYHDFKEKFSAEVTFDEFKDIWSDIFWPIHETIELIKKIKGNYPLYMISNINELHFEYLYGKHPNVFEMFDGLILSYKVKSVKPETAIYEALRKKSNCNYSDIIYIDDRKELIEEAKKLNLNCIQFVSTPQLITDLKKYAIQIPLS